MDLDWTLLVIPALSGVIGYVTNFAGIRLLFYPVEFWGVHVPGLQRAARLLPRRIQSVPGVLNGGIGWQGVIPSRAAKMGSIAVDKGIAKLGSPAEFYEQLEPDRIAEHILQTARGDIHALVDRIMEREHPKLWNDTPEPVREAVHARIQKQLPEIVNRVTTRVGEKIDQLLDIKLMVVSRIAADPALANRIFLEVGERELKFVINSGLWLGALLGALTVPLFLAIDQWWVLPVAGVVVGYLTNLIAIRMIFVPVEPREVGRFTLQGLFMRRQDEVAGVYADLIATDIITLSNIGEELLNGPRADRTRDMIEAALRPAVDRAVGAARDAVRIAIGRREYDAIRESVASEGAEYTMRPLTDPEFNQAQADRIRELLEQRIKQLPPDDFAELLRSATEEDEWMLILIGSVLGFVAGLLQAAVVGLV